MSKAVVAQPCAARYSESAPSPQPITTARRPPPGCSSTWVRRTSSGSVWSHGRGTSPRPAADQSSSYQRVGSPSATALTPRSEARSDQANLVLSDARAVTVARILTDFYDVPAENLVTQGYGERYLKVNTQ